MSEWAKVAEASKTTVCFKPHADHAVDRPDRAIWLLKQVDSPRIRIIYDYGHFYLEGLELESSLATLILTSPCLPEGFEKLPGGKHEYLLPGDGKTDYPEYFRILRQLRYSGYAGRGSQRDDPQQTGISAGADSQALLRSASAGDGPGRRQTPEAGAPGIRTGSSGRKIS